MPDLKLIHVSKRGYSCCYAILRKLNLELTNMSWSRKQLLMNINSTHLSLDKMAAISHTTFSSAFLWMKSFVFWLAFLSVLVQLSDGMAANRWQAITLNQCWSCLLMHMCSTRGIWVKIESQKTQYWTRSCRPSLPSGFVPVVEHILQGCGAIRFEGNVYFVKAYSENIYLVMTNTYQTKLRKITCQIYTTILPDLRFEPNQWPRLLTWFNFKPSMDK